MGVFDQFDPQADPAAPAAPAPSQQGPIKSFLSQFLYGAGQGLLAKTGLETDAEKQQRMFQQQQATLTGQRAQQTANDMSAYRQAQIGGLQAKADKADAENAPFIIPSTPDIPAALRGTSTTVGAWNSAIKPLITNLGKTDQQGLKNSGALATQDLRGDQQAAHDQVMADVRKDIANKQYGLAAARLKIAGSNLDIRQLEYRLRAYGTGENGEPVPGALFDADANPIGTAMAPNVRPTAAGRNAAERGETMQDLEQRIRGALADPSIASQLGPVIGRVNQGRAVLGNLDGPVAELYNDLKSYGAFQAGLHPVRGIGGLQYFDKVMGGLAQDPEQLLGKLNSNRATSNSVIKIGGKPTGIPNNPTPTHSGLPSWDRGPAK